MLAAFDAVLVVVGALSAEITGYGGIRELLIGIVVLSISVLLFAYRQMVQERKPFQFKATDDVSDPKDEAFA